MAVKIEQVINALNQYEPDCTKAAKLGPGALPHLDTLVKTADPLLASKAAYLASLIKAERSVEILKIAAQSKYPEVRVAAASGAHNLKSDKADDVLSLVKDDPDPGVRKYALKK